MLNCRFNLSHAGRVTHFTTISRHHSLFVITKKKHINELKPTSVQCLSAIYWAKGRSCHILATETFLFILAKFFFIFLFMWTGRAYVCECACLCRHTHLPLNLNDRSVKSNIWPFRCLLKKMFSPSVHFLSHSHHDKMRKQLQLPGATVSKCTLGDASE